jgi:hypothetical protein
MWLWRIFNPVKLFYALAAAAVVAVTLSLAVIFALAMDPSNWARIAVVIALPVTLFLLWKQDRDTLCPTCTTTARPFASTCQKCHDWLPLSTTSQQRPNPNHTVSWNQGHLS